MSLREHVRAPARAAPAVDGPPAPVADEPPTLVPRGVQVRSTARRSYLLHRLWRSLRGLVGGVLLTSAALFGWLSLLLPVHLLMDLSGGDDDLTPDERAVFDTAGRLLVLVAIGSTGAWVAGRQLLRTRRSTVLWLRKFQDRSAIDVVGAALDHIGRTWRVVTLDDLSATPVGVGLGLRVPGRLLTVAGRVGPRVRETALTVGRTAMRGAVAGLVALVAWSWSQGEGLLLLQALPGAGPRPDTASADLLVALLLVLAVPVVVLLAWLVVRLALLPLLGLVLLGQGVHAQITATEAAKLRDVRTAADIPAVTSSVVAASHRALAPRLTVLRVDGTIWQDTVVELARCCGAVVLDVSRPTEHLLWEVEQVTSRLRSRVVLVAHADRVDALLAPTATDALTQRLRTFLDGAVVLAYTTDLRGRLRFQRALFAELEGSLPPWRPDGADARRALLAVGGIAAVAVVLERAGDLVSAWL